MEAVKAEARVWWRRGCVVWPGGVAMVVRWWWRCVWGRRGGVEAMEGWRRWRGYYLGRWLVREAAAVRASKG